MLDRNHSIPLYEQLAQLFRTKIDTGEWPENFQLPSERELCEVYDVSRITIRHAIAIAERQDLLKSVHGVGTFVTHHKYEQALAKVQGFEQSLALLGVVASTTVHSSGTILSDLLLSGVLQVPAADPLSNLQLIGSGDSVPIVYYDSYLPIDVGTTMIAAAERAQEQGMAFTSLDLYRSTDLATPVKAAQTFEAITADAELSTLLEVNEGWPVLQVTSVISSEERPLEFRKAFYRGDKYKFAMERNLESMYLPE